MIFNVSCHLLHGPSFYLCCYWSCYSLFLEIMSFNLYHQSLNEVSFTFPVNEKTEIFVASYCKSYLWIQSVLHLQTTNASDSSLLHHCRCAFKFVCLSYLMKYILNCLIPLALKLPWILSCHWVNICWSNRELFFRNTGINLFPIKLPTLLCFT